MKKHHFIFVLILLSTSATSQANDLKINNIMVINRPNIRSSPYSVIFDIEWNNAWKNQKNHDAVWVFMKYNGYWNNHVKILSQGHQLLQNRSGNNSNPTIEVEKNGLGFFIYPAQNYRGDMNFKLQILIDTTGERLSRNHLNNLSVHGIEMVYIPKGSFTLVSPDEAAYKKAAFYKSNAEGKPDGLISINSENEIKVGPETGALYYWSERDIYNGDQKGPVPADFPKGFNAFYIMKYELNQGQYADFINKLDDNSTHLRSPIGGRFYYKKRGGIRLIDGKYVADNPNRPMNFISFTDALAYTDWAALRPITELEYTKAARGPVKPIPAEFVWGTNNYDLLERYVSDQGELTLQNKHTESEINDQNRPIFGHSYYWVMDLSGSLWEKVITIGNPIGRAFKGTHGDGKLKDGSATNEDWPKRDDETGGFGYRGGGYYEVGMTYGDFNPHSPIGYRYYGAWSGAPRYIAYGYRAGRSAE